MASYAPLPLSGKLGVILFLVAVPFLLDLFRPIRSDGNPLGECPAWPTSWILSSGFLGALLIRVWTQASQVGYWNLDHGDFAQAALSQSVEHGPSLLLTSTQHPFPYFRLLLLAFNLYQDPRVFDWVPAFLTILPGVVVFVMLRSVLGNPIASLTACFLWIDGALAVFSVSGAPVVQLPCLEVVALSIGVRCLVGRDRAPGWGMGALLGLIVGASVWTYQAAWALVLGMSLAGAVLALRKRLPAPFLVAYGTLLSCFILPLLWVYHREDFGQHVRGVSWLGSTAPWWTPVMNLFGYLAAFFWGGGGSCEYTAPLGGFFAPWIGAFVLIGLMEALKDSRRRVWIIFLMGVFFLPGMLSVSIEPARVVLVIPLLAFLGAWGFLRVFSGMGDRRAGVWASCLVLAGACWVAAIVKGWDPWHPFVPPVRPICTPVDEGYRKFFEEVSEQARREGPGHIWTDLCPQRPDVRAYPASRPFDLPKGQADWAVLWIREDLRSFLAPRLPGARWVSLPSSANPAYGRETLVFIPLDRSRLDRSRWETFNEKMHRASEMEFSTPEGGSVTACIAYLESQREASRGDPFLETVYWERLAALNRRELRFDADMVDLQNSLIKGCPAAHVWYQIGGNLLRVKDFTGASRCFRSATAAPDDSTAASVWLERLSQPASLPEIGAARRP